jgi:chromosome segregation ATPase
LAPRHEGRSSGSNDPIRDLEVRIERLTTELRHGNRERARDSHRIAELLAEIDRLQREIVERDRAIDWALNSRSIAWDCEANARAQVEELSVALENLQAYNNILHEEVHVLCDQFHPNVPPEVAEMGAGTS